MTFVPADFDVPTTFAGPGFRLEPLAPVHNERDHEAWMSSIDHIHGSPGFEEWKWPEPMTLEQNLADMEMHYGEFERREAFTYSILDGDDVVGCIYIYPDKGDSDATVRSWVRASRSELDSIVRRSMREWLLMVWPFESIQYAEATGS
jgi:hypothetical protein